MSKENIFRVDEFNQSAASTMIPERDFSLPELKSRPKPRPRTILTGNNKNRNIDHEGIENDSFALDEYRISSSGDHDHDFKSASKFQQSRNFFSDKFPSRMSSTSSSFNELKGKNPFTVTAEADIHYETHKSESSSTTSENKFHVENEITGRAVGPELPKPKPRNQFHEELKFAVAGRKRQDSSSSSESDLTEKTTPNVGAAREAKLAESQVQNKEDYLVITMPTDDKKATDEKQDADISSASEQHPASSSTSFLGKWKHAIKTFSREGSINLPNLKTKRKSREARQGLDKDIEVGEPEPEVKIPGEDVQQQTRPTLHRRNSFQEKYASLTPVHSSPGSASSKRDLHRREKDGEISKVLGITIHSSDVLSADPLVVHPVVKVTLMNEDGSYIPKRRAARRNQETAKTNSSEDEDDDQFKSKRKGKRKSRQKSASDKSREKLNKIRVNGFQLTNDVILPTLTQPFHVADYIAPSFAPTWNELVVFEEPYQKFIHEHSTCIFFFEIMDFLPMDYGRNQSLRNRNGSEEGWHKIAWGFLKPVGVNGVRNVNRKLRLQLYKPEALTTKEASYGPEIYCWWRLGKRTKLNSTLYVTVKGIVPPSCPSTNLHTLISMRKEDLTEALIESQLQIGEPRADADGDNNMKSNISKNKNSVVRKVPQWERMKGQSCKPPNKLLKSLPSSDFDSLRISISGNVHCVKFSPNGLLLAAGFDTEQLHSILIFEIPSGILMKSLRCHHSLIYDLAWTVNKKFSNESLLYLASASADFTASIWSHGNDDSMSLVKTLLHPSFVYCIRFHPTSSHLVATGCFDRIIRIWNIFQVPKLEDSPNDHADSTPIIMLDRHSSFVNCLEFHLSGKYLFSGDGEGSLYKWKNSSSNKKLWKVDKNIKLVQNSKSPLNSISIDPVNGTKLLVQSRESCLKIVDVETFLVLHTFYGFTNENYNIKSCFSPCGNLVLCGSEDGTLCIWDTDTTRILQYIKPESQSSNCVVTSVDYHPFDYYVAFGLLSTHSSSEACPIMLYTYAPLPKLKMSSVVQLKKLARLQRQKHEKIHDEESGTNVVEKSFGNDGKKNLKHEIMSNRSKSISPAPRNLIEATGGPQESVDSTDKFMSILWKLDTALKVTSRVIHAENKSDASGKNDAEPMKLSGKPTISPKPVEKRRRRRPSENFETISHKEISNNPEHTDRATPSNAREMKDYDSKSRKVKRSSEQRMQSKSAQNKSPQRESPSHFGGNGGDQQLFQSSSQDKWNSQSLSNKVAFTPAAVAQSTGLELLEYSVTGGGNKRQQRRQKMHIID